MANVNAPLGFQYRYSQSGASSALMITRCFVPATDGTAMFPGDLVTAVNGTDPTTGLPVVTSSVTAGVAGNVAVPYGVCLGVNPVAGVSIAGLNLNIIYRPASNAMYVDIITDPNAIYEIQSNGTVAAADMNKYATIANSALGNTTYGTSGMQMLESSVTATRSSGQFIIIGTVPDPTNAVSAANTRLFVKLVSGIFAL